MKMKENISGFLSLATDYVIAFLSHVRRILSIVLGLLMKFILVPVFTFIKNIVLFVWAFFLTGWYMFCVLFIVYQVVYQGDEEAGEIFDSIVTQLIRLIYRGYVLIISR